MTNLLNQCCVFYYRRPEGALIRVEAREAAAEMLGLNEQQRAEVITSADN